MNTQQIRRCLARIEQQVNAGQIAANQHDPRLVQLLQHFKGNDFQIEMVPLGLSVEEVWEKVTASDKGRIRPVSPMVGADDKGYTDGMQNTCGVICCGGDEMPWERSARPAKLARTTANSSGVRRA